MISPKKPKILSISAKENRPDGQPRGTWSGKAEACFTARRNGSGSRDSPEMADEGSSGGGRNTDPLEGVRPIVLKLSESLDESRFIAGACFNDTGLGLDGLLGSLASTGFQASYLGVVNQMLDWRLSHEKPTEDCDEAELDPKYRESVKCKIFLGFTSNLVSSGLWHTGCNQRNGDCWKIRVLLLESLGMKGKGAQSVRKAKGRTEALEEKERCRKERCLYCSENPSMLKHLVVAIGNFTYLMLPQFEPVVAGHCVILPLQHESAVRTVDKNVWEDIRNFKKCLLKMFAQQDKDVVFMETVIKLGQTTETLHD